MLLPIVSGGTIRSVIKGADEVSEFAEQTVKHGDELVEGAGKAIKFDSLDDFVNNPKMLEGMDPTEFYDHLSENGYNSTPLSKGSTGGISFKQGGGFKVNWGGDRIIQYHPGGGVHSGSYWKISSGATGIIKIPISGTYIP